jgi:hypothetical protein
LISVIHEDRSGRRWDHVVKHKTKKYHVSDALTSGLYEAFATKLGPSTDWFHSATSHDQNPCVI